MAQWLRALIALSGDLSSILSTYMAAHNCLKLQFQGIWDFHRYTFQQNINAHKLNKLFLNYNFDLELFYYEFKTFNHR